MAVFKPLSRENLMKIIDTMLNELSSRLDTKGLKIDVDEQAKAKILEKGFKPKYGARPLRRAIQSMLEDKLADFMLTENILKGSEVNISVDGEELKCKIIEQVEQA